VCCGFIGNSFRELDEGVGVRLNKVLLRWGLLLLWCGLIFFGTANRHFTGESTHAVVAQAAPSIGLASAGQLDWLNLAVRKVTHVVMFAVLGLLAWRAFETWRPQRAATWAWLFVTLYAASDEFHQHFVPGRTASVWDVLLDSTAAAVVLLVVPYVAGHVGRQKAEPPR
jgi:VanZ family protein